MKNTMIKVHTKDNRIGYLACPEVNVDDMIGFMEDTGNLEKAERYTVGNMPLEALPEEVQNKVKSILKAYDNANVVYEYGKFSASASVCIKSHYHYDHFVCGRYTAEEVYTEEERRQNYQECFGC